MHLGALPEGIVGVVISDTPSSCPQLDVWCSHTLQSDRTTDLLRFGNGCVWLVSHWPFGMHFHFQHTPRKGWLNTFISFHGLSSIFILNNAYINTIIRSYKILSPLEYCRANIHGLNWQLLCLGPWYCGISAAAFRRSESKEKPLSDFLRHRFMAGFRDVSWAAARAALEDAERFKECQDVPSVDKWDERVGLVWQTRRLLSELRKRNTLPERTRAQSRQSHEFAPGSSALPWAKHWKRVGRFGTFMNSIFAWNQLRDIFCYLQPTDSNHIKTTRRRSQNEQTLYRS